MRAILRAIIGATAASVLSLDGVYLVAGIRVFDPLPPDYGTAAVGVTVAAGAAGAVLGAAWGSRPIRGVALFTAVGMAAGYVLGGAAACYRPPPPLPSALAPAYRGLATPRDDDALVQEYALWHLQRSMRVLAPAGAVLGGFLGYLLGQFRKRPEVLPPDRPEDRPDREVSRDSASADDHRSAGPWASSCIGCAVWSPLLLSLLVGVLLAGSLLTRR
jgi:hypothetical protein